MGAELDGQWIWATAKTTRRARTPETRAIAPAPRRWKKTPRDRNASFEPQIMVKEQRFEGFDQAIISLYSQGLTTRKIEGHLLENYGRGVVGPGPASEYCD